VGPRVCVDTVSSKISSPRRNSNPDHLTVQPVISRFTDWAMPALSRGLVPVVNIVYITNCAYYKELYLLDSDN
jgi:hypothetical protein